MTLTEQWKKGELPYGYYYIKTISGGEVIDRYYRDCTDYDLCEYGDVWENRFEDEIIEVLAPVLSYEEWLENESHCAVYSDINKWLKQENQQLKELLLKCLDKLESLNRGYDVWGGELTDFIEEITNAIGEKK